MFGYLAPGHSPLGDGSYLPNFVFGELCIVWTIGSMALFISLIFFRGGPSKIVSMAIRRVPIIMGYLMSWRWFWAMKRLADKYMDQRFNITTVFSKRDGGVSIFTPRGHDFSNPCAARWFYSCYDARFINHVIWCSFDNFCSLHKRNIITRAK